MAVLHVRLFGRLEIRCGDTPVADLDSARLRSLFARLVLHAGHPEQRSRLAFAIWPDSTEAQAHANLRNLIFRLKRALPDSDAFLTLTGQSIQWKADAPYTLDVADFRSLARGKASRENVHRAVELYRADLLPECYDDWVEHEREKLRREFSALLQAGISLGERERDWEVVASWAQRLVEHDPLDEAGWRSLMSARGALGDRTGVRRAFEGCAAALRREIDAEPSRETRQQYQQLMRTAIPSAVPRNSDHAPDTLPAYPNSFLGRQRESQLLETLLGSGEARLVTLTGTGGVGKTRLAVHAARRLSQGFEHGAHFVDLAPIRHHDEVASALARALGVKEMADRSIVDGLKSFLRTRRTLLVLDNFEHVLGAAFLVSDLLRNAPHLKVLVTSREPLGLYGEQELELLPLALPEGTQPFAAAEVGKFGSVALFVERARAADPHFELTEANAPAVVGICSLLDGLPLAIELAAAKSRRLAPEDILPLLSRPLEVLGEGPRDADARHRKLRAAIEWSYDLLDPNERRLFRRLSVFAGGFLASSAVAVCAERGETDKAGLAEDLRSLERKSLLRRREIRDGEPRYEMLSTVREYALERLEGEEEADLLRRRHADHYLNLALEAGPELRGPRRTQWLDRLEPERYDLRAALSWFLSNAPDGALRMTASLWWFWYLRSYLDEGRQWLGATLKAPGSDLSPLRAQILHGDATLASDQGKIDEARSAARESLRLFSRLGDESGLAQVLNVLGHLALAEGDDDEAAESYAQSLSIYRRLGDANLLIIPLVNLGAVEVHRGEYESGERLLTEALSLARGLQHDTVTAAAAVNLAIVARRRASPYLARELLSESLRLFAGAGHMRGVAECLREFASLAVIQAHPLRAARLFAAARHIAAGSGITLSPSSEGEYAELAANARALMDERAWNREWLAGGRMSIGDAVEYALTAAPDLASRS
jgi:predicted ATPase/DNA-binding SARP family transcriptional activator